MPQSSRKASATKSAQPTYLTLLEVAVRLRLGEIRRPREGQPILTSDDERRVRAARHFLKQQRIPTIKLGGQLLVPAEALSSFEREQVDVSGRHSGTACRSDDASVPAGQRSRKTIKIRLLGDLGDHSQPSREVADHSGNHSRSLASTGSDSYLDST